MSSRVESLHVTVETNLDHASPFEVDVTAEGKRPTWSADRFASQQVRGLVRQVFLSQQSCHQVVLAPVDAETDISELCLEIGKALSTESGKEVSLITEIGSPLPNGSAVSCCVRDFDHEVKGVLREWSHPASDGVWLLPKSIFWSEANVEFAADVLRRRLDQLRVEFDFTVIQAPAAGQDETAALLGRLTDGLILVIQAHRTRRLAAQRVLSHLRDANARLLGTVLCDRTFPIPERLYRNC